MNKLVTEQWTEISKLLNNGMTISEAMEELKISRQPISYAKSDNKIVSRKQQNAIRGTNG